MKPGAAASVAGVRGMGCERGEACEGVLLCLCRLFGTSGRCWPDRPSLFVLRSHGRGVTRAFFFFVAFDGGGYGAVFHPSRRAVVSRFFTWMMKYRFGSCVGKALPDFALVGALTYFPIAG